MNYLFAPKLHLMKEKRDMLAPLIQMISEIKPIPKALEEALIDGFEINKKEKNEILLKEGNICKNLWFLVDGLLRSYHNIGDKEVTSRIMFTNHIVIAPGSFFTQTPATESIQALADCEVAAMSFTTLQNIYTSFPEFNLHTRIITEQYFYKTEQRLYMLRKHDAGAKYNYFLENYETYLKNIPQKYIASFLNIAPETLSRVRNKLGK
jgi:CRP/FNR family transcriptional regulator, anaerobic regulatory protein